MTGTRFTQSSFVIAFAPFEEQVMSTDQSTTSISEEPIREIQGCWNTSNHSLLLNGTADLFNLCNKRGWFTILCIAAVFVAFFSSLLWTTFFGSYWLMNIYGHLELFSRNSTIIDEFEYDLPFLQKESFGNISVTTVPAQNTHCRRYK